MQAAGWTQEEYDDWSHSSYRYAREYMGELNALAKYRAVIFQSGKKSDFVVYGLV